MPSKSLGQLTLDLVARIGGFTGPLDKAGRESKKKMEDIKKGVDTAAKALGAMAVAGGAALGAVVVSTVQTANEISKLSAVANASTDEFQRWSAGAKVAGIEQEKLADILKDVNDRVGDFIQTGGGPMADFFEKIAPKVGVTAEEFRNLSGPQALGLYVDTLEKAGVNQQDMTFYLEAMASDATLLLPLLRDGAAGMKAFGDEAARAGAILSKEAIAKAQELNAVMFLMEQSTTGLKNQIGEALIPVLADFAAGLSDIAVDGSVAKEIADGLATGLKSIAATAVGAYAAIQLVGKGIAGIAAIADAASTDAKWYEKLLPGGTSLMILRNADKIKSTLDIVGEDLSGTIEKYAKVLDGIWVAGTGDGAGGASEAENRVKRLAEFLKEIKRQAGAAGSGFTPDSSESNKSADVRGDSILERLQADDRGNAILAAQAAEFDATRKALDQRYAIEQEYQERVQALRDGQRQGFIQTQAEFNELVIAAEKDRNEKLIDLNGGFWEQYLSAAEENLTSFDELAGNMLDGFSSRFGDAFESMVFDAETLGDSISGLAEGMARSVVNALGEMAAQWIAYQAVQLITGQSAQAAAVAGAAAAGTAMAASYAPAAAFASLASFGANAAPAAAALTTTTALSQGLALAGMAHEGIDSIPQTGTWLLEKGERVTTAETSAKLDRTLDRVQQGQGGGKGVTIINQTTGRVDKATERTLPNGERAILIEETIRAIDARLGDPNSSTSRAMSRHLNVQRAR